MKMEVYQIISQVQNVLLLLDDTFLQVIFKMSVAVVKKNNF